ncbi:MAG: hypothetical protein Q9178_003830 [Gyalolechia marmorata]
MHGEIDITQFHPLRINLIRVFFEALCVRLGKVDDFKRGIGNCKDGDEYLVLQALFADLIADYGNTWFLRTNLDRRYIEIVKDTPLLLHACKDIIQKLSKDEKAHKDISEKDKSDKETNNNNKENTAGTKPTTIHHPNHEDCIPEETYSVLHQAEHIIMRNTEQMMRNTEHIMRTTENIRNKVNKEKAARNYSGNELPHINNPDDTIEAFKVHLRRRN